MEARECIGKPGLAPPSTGPNAMIQEEAVFADWATLQKITVNVGILPQESKDLYVQKSKAGIMEASKWEPPDEASFTVSEMLKEARTSAFGLLVGFIDRIAVQAVI